VKCIRCNHDSNYPDRTNQTCPACKGKFAFEPRTGDKLTDQAFKNAIDRVSSEGSVKFTQRNLYYEVDRLGKRSASTWGAAIGWFATAATAIAVGAAGAEVLIYIGAALLVVAAIKIPHDSQKRVKLTEEQFEVLYARWKSVHGAPAGLFTSKPLRVAPKEPRARELAEDLRDELSQYSFDRAVITDSRETADLLLMNDFHFENNCAVLSIDGHPAHAFATVRKMLRNNPKIEVYALHDCSPEGCELAWTLRQDPAWFKDVGQVYDVALRPAQARKMKASWLPGRALQVAEHPALTEQERDFLRENTIELAAIRPEQLVKRLFRAMTLLPAAASAASDGGTTGADGSTVWTTDASAGDGGGDAFG
jgi:hypothetical protein